MASYEEQRTQMQFIEYLERINFPYFNHSPNEGKRTPQEGNKLKRMGMSKGFPDLEIPYPTSCHHGLYLEFKTEKGKVSEEQMKWLERLNGSGYLAVVVRSLDDAMNVFKNYLKEKI